MRDKDTSSSLVQMTYSGDNSWCTCKVLKNVNPASVNCDPVTPLRYVIQLIGEGVKKRYYDVVSDSVHNAVPTC